MAENVWEPMTVAGQAPLSMGYSREEYRRELPFPSQGDLTDPGWKLGLWHLMPWQADSLPLSQMGSPASL